MPNANGPTLPIFGQGVSSDVLITNVNHLWGMTGAGDPGFWNLWSPMVFRDSTATSVTGGQLQSTNGAYDLLACDGMRFTYKGDVETRDIEQIAAAILMGPYVASRIDGPAVPLPLRKSYDPTGRIEQAIRTTFTTWANMLPLVQITGLLVNGRLSAKHPAQVCYDGLSLFNSAHKINPTSKVLPASGTYSNTITLPAAADEKSWVLIKDKLLQVPDLDGQFLPNAAPGFMPMIMVGTTAQRVRWAHVLGGTNLPRELLMQANSAAVHSVVVGDAEIMVNPYLVTMADDKDAIQKRSFVFSRNGRAPFIWREEETPIIKDTGASGPQAHTNNARVIYCYAHTTAGLGEWRSVFEVIEP